MSKVFIRTYLKTNKYKSFYRHNFLIGKSPNKIKEKLNNIDISNNGMIYVSNGYLMINIIDNFNNLSYREHINFIERNIRTYQQKIDKTGFKNIYTFLSKNKEKLGIKTIVEYIDEITLDYDSGLSLFKDIDLDKISNYELNNISDLTNNKYLTELIINNSIRKKNKVGYLFIGFKEHANYFLYILKNYNFITLDKIFITKYLDGSDIKNFQITFKIKEKALTKIIYETLFNKITKDIYDKALKSAGQLKIFKTGKDIKRQIKLFGQDINIKTKKYIFTENNIKSIENVSFKDIITQNIRNKISDNIDLTNYKNKQYSLNNSLIFDNSIKSIFSIIFYFKNYYNHIYNKNIPEYKKRIDQLILNIKNNILFKIHKDFKQIGNGIKLNNLNFIQSFSCYKDNELNKIKLLNKIIKELDIFYGTDKEKDDNTNEKILSFLKKNLKIHLDYYKLLQYKYNRTKNKVNSTIKTYNLFVKEIKNKKLAPVAQENKKKKRNNKIKRIDINKLKILLGLLGNIITEEENYLEKIRKNKNIYYNYISYVFNKKQINIKYSYKKELSFNLLSGHIFNIFDNKKFKKIKIKKHNFLDFIISILERLRKRIIQKKDKNNNFQNLYIFNKKLNNLNDYINYLEKLKKGKNIFYNKNKIINFLRQNIFILEDIFNIQLKLEGKVSKAIFLIQKDFFNIEGIETDLQNNDKENRIKTNENKIYSLNNEFLYGTNIERKILNKIKDNYNRHYYEGNRYKFITWTFFYLRNKIEYYNNKNNSIGVRITENFINNIERKINIENFISEHGYYIIEQLKKTVPI